MSLADHIVIVDGNIKDLDAVMAVMENSFDLSCGEAWSAAQCANMLPMPGVWLFLAKDADTVHGFALGRSVLKEAELLLLAVHKSSQKKGVGRLLLDHFIEKAKKRGVEKIHLEVREGNPAIELYNLCGFICVGRRKKYYTTINGQTYDALTMSKIII